MKWTKVSERMEVTASNLSGSVFSDVNISGAVFENVNLSGAHFDDVNMSAWTLHNVNLTGLKVTDANMAGAAISDALLTGMTINGILVTDLLAAYRSRFAGDPAATNLENWQAFEDDNPGAFAGMYNFWIQKSQ